MALQQAKTEEAFTKPRLDTKVRGWLSDALDELEKIEWLVSEAEVASDHLARELKDAFFPAKGATAVFRGKLPSLSEVVEKLNSHFNLHDDALLSAKKLQTMIEESYREEVADDVISEIQVQASTLVEKLKAFINSCPN